MRILVLTSSYPTPHDNTASAFLADSVQALTERGHDVTVVAPCHGDGSQNSVSAGGAVIRYFQYLPWAKWQTLVYRGGMYDNARRNPLRIMQLPSYLCVQYQEAVRLRGPATIIHAHWMFPGGLVGALVKRTSRAPLVISVHSTDLHALQNLPGGRLVARAISSHADRLHFVADFHRQRFEKWVGADVLDRVRCYVAPMGVADAMVRQSRSRLAALPRVGFMGRLIPLKGVDRLLRACAAIECRELMIAGAGPDHAKLVRLASDLNVRARFIGPVSGTAKTIFLDSCDILVFPSRQYCSGRAEGLPVSLLEALARGRVVVASDSGGVPEIIRHGYNGYLYNAQQQGALETILAEVLSDWPASAIVAERGRQAAARLTASALASRHELEYAALCSERVVVPEPV